MITENMKNLVDLALKDAVITYREKEILIGKAIEEGSSLSEINQYINEQLEIRLSKRGREELKACPKCGAQVPLLSDNCPFCNYEYQLSGANNAVRISSARNASDNAAQAIEAENARTADENQNIESCPNCGHPYPLISNICPACRHVLHKNTDNAQNIRNLIARLRGSIDEYKSTNPINGMELYKYRIFEYMFPIGIFLLILMLLRADAGIAWLLFFTGVPCLAAAMFFGPIYMFYRKEAPYEIDNRLFSDIENECRLYASQIDILYGDDSEARKMLSELEKEIEELKTVKRKRHLKPYWIAAIVVAAFTILFAALKNPDEKLLHSYQDNIDKLISENNYNRKAIEYYSTDDEFDKYFKIPEPAKVTFDLGLRATSPCDFHLIICNVKALSTHQIHLNPDELVYEVSLLGENHEVLSTKNYQNLSLAFLAKREYDIMTENFQLETNGITSLNQIKYFTIKIAK